MRRCAIFDLAARAFWCRYARLSRACRRNMVELKRKWKSRNLFRFRRSLEIFAPTLDHGEASKVRHQLRSPSTQRSHLLPFHLTGAYSLAELQARCAFCRKHFKQNKLRIGTKLPSGDIQWRHTNRKCRAWQYVLSRAQAPDEFEGWLQIKYPLYGGEGVDW